MCITAACVGYSTIIAHHLLPYLDSPVKNMVEKCSQPSQCDCEARGYVCECTEFTEKLLKWGRSFADVYGSTVHALKPCNMDTMFAEFLGYFEAIRSFAFASYSRVLAAGDSRRSKWYDSAASSATAELSSISTIH